MPLVASARRLRRRRRLVEGAVVLASLVLLVPLAGTSCRKADTTPVGPGGVDVGTFDKSALLESFAACTLGVVQTFAADADALAAATERAAHDATGLDAARAAFLKAFASWQVVEAFQFGPAATLGTTPGAKDVRDNVYAWPLFDRCLVDQQLVSQSYATPELPRALASTRGLVALEYLLFYGGADNGCAATAQINAQGTWAALGTPELAARKARYAAAAAALVRDKAHELRAAWDPAGANFHGELAQAGKGSAAYASAQVAFNAVSDAIFYVEDEVKDVKLGRPLGVSDCAAASCPEAVESPYALASKTAVRQNLVGFQKLLVGCGGEAELGFDDLLVAAGATALAADMRADMAAALAAVDAIPQADLGAALREDPARVRALYDAVKKLSDDLKSEFVTVLDLELPRKVEGDND